MKKILALVFAAFATIGFLTIQAQTIPRTTGVMVRENGNLLVCPNAGGLNNPHFSHIDLNGDGKMDLIVFDRNGKVILPFVNQGGPGQVNYSFNPEYIPSFPSHSQDFFLCRDFDCDGKNDLFYGTTNGIKVYKNTSTASTLSFQLAHDTLLTDKGLGPVMVYVNIGDVPDFIDVDSDGDLDLLTFDGGGNFVEWHKNYILENQGTCAGFELAMADGCWGKFQESGQSQDITLGISCRRQPGEFRDENKSTVHSGSTLAAFDEEGDGDYELVVGDLLYNSLTYLRNGGTASSAFMDTTYGLFPTYDASVDLTLFAAPFFLDINNDSKKDLLVSPNTMNISVNYDNVWYYQNVNPGNGVTLSRIKKTFLIDQMVDAGMGAYPVLFDHNNDGLLDLVIGNYSKKISASNMVSGLVLYENIGTATQPEFNLANRNYAGLNTAFIPQLLGLTPTFGDLDGDGDKDMILGDADGKLNYLENIAASGQPANFANLQVNYKGIDVGTLSTPILIDVDRDGKLDLVIGELSGTLKYFRNIGTTQVPDFSSTPTDNKWGFVDTQPICCTGSSFPFIFENTATGRYDLLVGSDAGNIMYFEDIEPQYGDTFQLTQTRFGEINEGQRTAITGADLDHDGEWDWIVGNIRGGLGFYSGNGPVATSITESEIANVDWEVFPNPGAGTFAISLNGKVGKMAIKIFDLAGKKIAELKSDNPMHILHVKLEEVPNGTYLIELELDGQFAGVKKLVIAH